MENKNPRLEAPRRPEVFTCLSSDFEDVVKVNGFVDNTELLYVFLGTGKRRVELITAPPKFGKSTNLSMFRRFCEMEVDAETGALKTLQNPLTSTITDTKNYLIFANNSLKIMEYSDIVANHLGRHPVLYASFLCNWIMKTTEDANEFCRKVAHDAFYDHQYLCQSEKLSAAEREYCQDWCDPKKYKLSKCFNTNEALERLCIYLYKHFTRDVLFLVDEYDSIVSRALLDSNESDLEAICMMPLNMMGPILKADNNNIHLLGALVTGVSYTAGIGWSNSANLIVPRTFSIGHEFTKFYGLRGEQIDDLLSKLAKAPNFKLDQNAREVISSHYNGYEFLSDDQDSDRKMYCTWSVMNYVQEGKVDWYRSGSCFIHALNKIFSNHAVRQRLVALLDGKSCPLDMKLTLTIDHLKLLRQQMQGDVEQNEIDFFLSFLLELGYLTIDSDKAPITYVKIPNCEVQILFLGMLRRYYASTYTTQFHKLKAGKSSFDKLPSVAKPNVSDVCFKTAVKNFRFDFEELFKIYAKDCTDLINEPSLHCLMVYLLTSVGFAYSPELFVPITKCYLDVVGIREDFGLLLRIKYDVQPGCSARDVLGQIEKRKYNRILKEIGIEQHVIMGVCIDVEGNVTISSIRNSKSPKRGRTRKFKWNNVDILCDYRYVSIYDSIFVAGLSICLIIFLIRMFV